MKNEKSINQGNQKKQSSISKGVPEKVAKGGDSHFMH